MEKHEAALATLELFNEKADELLDSTFFNQARGGGAVVEFKRSVGWDGIFVGPDEESTKALILTLRIFMQKSDRISLEKMTALYHSLPVTPEVSVAFASRRLELDRFLDSESRLSISEGGPMTYREILETLVYGTYAHVNPRYRRTYEGIRTNAFFPLFKSALVDSIVAVASCTSAVRQINDLAAAELRGVAS